MSKIFKYIFSGNYILFLPCAEHIPAAVIGKIAVRKTAAAEHTFQVNFIFVIIIAFNCFFNGGNGGGNIFGAFHSALNFKADNAEIADFIEIFNKAQIFKTQITTAAALCRKRQAARLSAKPPVSASAANHCRKQALPRHAHTKRTVNKNFKFQIGAFSDFKYFFCRHFPWKNGT